MDLGAGRRYLPEIARATEELAARVYAVLDSGAMPLVLGGDHSMSIGSIAGIARYCQEHQCWGVTIR